MIAENHRFQDLIPAPPGQSAPHSRRSRSSAQIRRVATAIGKNPLVVLIGVLNAIFYCGAFVLLANL